MYLQQYVDVLHHHPYTTIVAGGSVHFEAFQVSEQCVKLWKEGWFVGEDVHTGVSMVRYAVEA